MTHTTRLIAALDALQAAEAAHRRKAELHGCDSMAAGQARDRMRSAGYQARQLLREIESENL